MIREGEIINLAGTSCEVIRCRTCGVIFAMSHDVLKNQRKEGGYHTCPNGHSRGWDEKNSENARARREAERNKQRLAQMEDELREAKRAAMLEKRTAAAYKGQVTKLKKRARAGVCPCCNRHFTNLERHMASKHPDMDPAEPLKVIEGAEALGYDQVTIKAVGRSFQAMIDHIKKEIEK